MDARVVRTKRDLEKSLKDLLANTPFDKISVKDICNHANISKMTFYKHYQDKNDLLAQLIASVGEEIKQKAIAASLPLGPSDSFEARVQKCTIFSVEYLKECFTYKNLLIRIEEPCDSNASGVVYFTAKSFVYSIVETYYIENHYPKRMLAAFLAGGFVSIMLEMLKEDRFDEVEAYGYFKDAFTKAFSNRLL